MNGFLRLYPVYAVILATVLAAARLPGKRLWGLNHLSYLPRTTTIALAALSLGLALLSLGKLTRVNPLYRRVAGFYRRHRATRWIAAGVACLATSAILWALRSRTTLLGDGSLVVKEGSQGLVNLRALLTTALAQVMTGFPGNLGGGNLQTTYGLISCLAGAGLVAVVLWFTGKLGWDPSRRFLWAAFTFSLGTTALLAGYVENYTLFYLVTFWYLATAILYLKGLTGPALPLAALALAPACHVSGILLIPSALITFTRRGNRLTTTLAVAVSLWWGAFLAAIAGKLPPGGSLFLEPAGPYGIFSPRHLADLANEVFLVCPGLPLVIMLFPLSRDTKTGHDYRLFFLSLAVPFVLFGLVVNPGLGLARDWDLFAATIWIPAALLFFPAAERLAAHLESAHRAALLFAAVAAVTTVPWILVNHDADSSVERFGDLLRLYDKRSAYGYEILSDYYLKTGDLDRARDALEQSIRISGNPRYYGAMGNLLMLSGDTEKAEYYYRQALAREPDNAWNLRNLGVFYARNKRYDRAEPLLRKAIRLNPGFATGYHDLGKLCYLTGRLPEAMKLFKTAIRLDPRNPANYRGLAKVLLEMGLPGLARTYLEKALELKPDYQAAAKDLKEIDDREKTGKAAPGSKPQGP